MKKKRTLSTILLILLIIAFLASGGYLFHYFWMAKQTEDELSQLQKIKQEAFSDAEEETEVKSETGRSIQKGYRKLYKKNSDLIGWVTVKNTKIDYPVMQTPEEEEYYIHRDFYGEYSSAGTLFVDLESNVQKPSDNILIYGHNMKTGKMFHDLLKYENESFYKNHKYIQFDTIYGNGTYEVIAAFRTHILTEKEDGFRYYQFFNAEDESAFNQYVSGCKALTGYTIDTDASYGDSLLTLSTCAYHTDNGRFVVVAKKLTP